MATPAKKKKCSFHDPWLKDSLIQPLIGTHTSVKCIESEDGCEYVRDAIVLLNKLDIEHPVGQYIVRVCNGFITQYRTGGDNLLFFICEWMKAASLLCQMGLSIRTIITVLKTVVNDCVCHAETHSISVGALTSEKGNKVDSHEVNGTEDLLHGHTVPHRFSSKESYTNQPLAIGSTRKKSPDFKQTSQLLDSSYDYVHGSQRKSVKTAPNKELKENNIDSNNCIDVKDSPQIKTVTDDGFVEILIKQPTFGFANNLKDNRIENEGPLLDKSDHLQSTAMTFKAPKVDDRPSKGLYSNNAVKEVTSKAHTRENHVPLITQTLGKDKDSVDDDDDDFSWFLTPDQTFDSTANAKEDQLKDDDNNAPVIYLKMKNIKADEIAEDDDDISWFFTPDKSLERSEKDEFSRTTESAKVLLYPSTETSDPGHIYNEELAQYHTKGIEDALNASSVSHDKTEASIYKKTEDTDTDLISEINDLKINIENDLKLLKCKSLTNGFVRKTDPNLDISDSDGDEDEFCHCWDEIGISKCQIETGASELSVSDLLDDVDDDDEFVTVQFTHDKKATGTQTCNLDDRNTFNELSSNDGVQVIQRNDSQTKEFKETIVMDNQQKVNVLSTTKDIKKFDTLLKSLNKETKNIPHAGRVLNRSRHFRTFQSICNQVSEIVPECDVNDGKSSCQECWDNPFLKGSVKNNHVESSGMAPFDSQKDTTIENKVEVKFNLKEVDNCTRATNTSLVGTITPANEICENDHRLQQENISKNPQTSVSDMNALLDKLNTFTKHSTNSKRLVSKDLQDNNSGNIESEKTKNSVVCKGHGIRSAVSTRSRHLNMETALSADKIGITNIKLEKDDINSDVPEDQVETETYVDKQSSKFNMDVTNTTSDMKNKSLHSKTVSTERMENWENSYGMIGTVEGMLDIADKGIVKVICDAVSKLESQGNLSMLDKLTDCYPISGFKRDPRLIKGLVLTTSLDCASALYRLKRETSQVLLVNADITPMFRHKGYKSSNLATNYTVDYFRTHYSGTDSWTQEVTKVLTKLNVDVILARGRISEEVFSLCDHLNITAIEQVPYKKLKLLSDVTETDMAIYVKLATQDNVCSGVRLNHLSSDVLDKNSFSGNQTCEIIISLEHNNPQTVVLSELTPVLVDLKEQEFWECFHHVTSCLKAGVLLPGNAQTEVHCIEFLRNKKEMFHQSYSESQDPNKYCLPLVYETIEQSFHKYVSKFRTSVITGKLDCVYDDPISKCAAWRQACDTVCTILNLEYYIITGIAPEIQTGRKNLIL